MANTYNLQSQTVPAQPRSKRRKNSANLADATQSTSSSSTTEYIGAGVGDGHTHSNKADLDKLSTDSDRYIYVEQLEDDGSGNVSNVKDKAKSGYSDEANHAAKSDEATNAIKWENHNFADYLNQPLRKEDIVNFLAVITGSDKITGVDKLDSSDTTVLGALKAALVYLTKSDAATTYLNKITNSAQTVNGETSFNAALHALAGLIVTGQVNANDVQSSSFASGMLGNGFKLWMENGTSHLQVDEGTFRKRVTFFEILVASLKNVGGQQIISPANCVLSRVEETDTYYIAYFKASDGNTTIRQEWSVGDQARHQTFNLSSGNRYYWRYVMEVSTSINENNEHWIKLSKTDYDTSVTNDAPAIGDNVSSLGHRTDTTRQSALVFSAYGDDAPYIKQYVGINSYSLVGKEVQSISPKGNKFTGSFTFESGNKVEDAISQSLAEAKEYSNDEGSPITINSCISFRETPASIVYKGVSTTVPTIFGLALYKITKEDNLVYVGRADYYSNTGEDIIGLLDSLSDTDIAIVLQAGDAYYLRDSVASKLAEFGGYGRKQVDILGIEASAAITYIYDGYILVGRKGIGKGNGIEKYTNGIGATSLTTTICHSKHGFRTVASDKLLSTVYDPKNGLVVTQEKFESRYKSYDAYAGRIEANESAISQTPNHISFAVSKVQVGVRNLFAFATCRFGYQSVSNIDKTIGAFSYTCISTLENDLRIVGFSANNPEAIAGGDFIVSFLIAASRNIDLISTDFCDSASANITNITTSYKRVNLYYTTGSDYLASYGGFLDFHPNAANTGAIVYFKNFQIVRGNKPVDWALAPEDLNKNFADTNASLKVTSDKVEAQATSINSLTGRVSTAESKITPDAILSTVSNKAIVGNGKNMCLRSNCPLNVTNGRLINWYALNTDWVPGRQYTITIKGGINGATSFWMYINPNLGNDCNMISIGNGLYRGTFTKDSTYSIGTEWMRKACVYTDANATYAYVEWIMIEEGNVGSASWSPAEEDYKISEGNMLVSSGVSGYLAGDGGAYTYKTLTFATQPVANEYYTISFDSLICSKMPISVKVYDLSNGTVAADAQFTTGQNVKATFRVPSGYTANNLSLLIYGGTAGSAGATVTYTNACVEKGGIANFEAQKRKDTYTYINQTANSISAKVAKIGNGDNILPYGNFFDSRAESDIKKWWVNPAGTSFSNYTRVPAKAGGKLDFTSGASGIGFWKNITPYALLKAGEYVTFSFDVRTYNITDYIQGTLQVGLEGAYSKVTINVNNNYVRYSITQQVPQDWGGVVRIYTGNIKLTSLVFRYLKLERGETPTPYSYSALDTGINIASGEIKLIADKTSFLTNSGEKAAEITEAGLKVAAINTAITSNLKPHVEIENGLACFYNAAGTPQLKMGIDETTGQIMFRFYDSDGTVINDYSPIGQADFANPTDEEWELRGLLPVNKDGDGFYLFDGQTDSAYSYNGNYVAVHTAYKYYAPTSGGRIIKRSSIGSDDAIGVINSGPYNRRYFYTGTPRVSYAFDAYRTLNGVTRVNWMNGFFVDFATIGTAGTLAVNGSAITSTQISGTFPVYLFVNGNRSAQVGSITFTTVLKSLSAWFDGNPCDTIVGHEDIVSSEFNEIK